MGIYAKYVLPHVVNFACGTKANMRQREKVVPLASGRVLEVGFGSGLNLPYYDAGRVEHVWGLDPSSEMWALAREKTGDLSFGFEFLEAPAESIPLDTNSVDSVLVTFSMCTIPDIATALAEIRRVLRSHGRMFFCEHGLAPDANVRKWQNRINPVWQRLGGGCNLNRDIPQLIAGAGFQVLGLQSTYIPGWKPASYHYWGSATP